MRTGKYILAALMVLGFTAMAYAAPVGLTSDADATQTDQMWLDDSVALSIGFVGDFVSERKIDVDSGEFEMNAYLARIGLSVIDRFNFYVDLGAVQDMEYTHVSLGEQHKVSLDDAFMWGVGGSALIYRWNNGLEIGVNASYRTAEMELTNVSVDGVDYARTGSLLTLPQDGDFEEVQGAIELAWKTDFLAPYIGVKFSDVEVDAAYTLAPNTYDANGKNASQNVGIFVGLTITPDLDAFDIGRQLAINLEGRFIDEEAFNVGLTYKF